MNKAQLVDLILKDKNAGFESKASAERAFDAIVARPPDRDARVQHPDAFDVDRDLVDVDRELVRLQRWRDGAGPYLYRSQVDADLTRAEIYEHSTR